LILSGYGLPYWLPYYFIHKLTKRVRYESDNNPIHIVLCIVDHFEPFNGPVPYSTAKQRVNAWIKQYPEFASKHSDADGKVIQHTWFYPPHLDHCFLPYLVELCKMGYGELEMHLHHNHMDPFPDTSQTLREKILRCIEDYGKHDIFSQPDGKPRFAFIHGDWSLDNSGGETLCGVNDELSILRECGCYADFTFPCLNLSQPAMVNSIYYAIDNPRAPKSYNRGVLVRKGKERPANALMMIQGIIGLRYNKSKKYKFAIEYSDLDCNNPPTPSRVDYWIRNAIQIEGQPNWRFIKLHTHGAPEIRWDVNFGKSAEQAFSYLEAKYNDGNKFILHYTSAREMYNIIKAAESGAEGNPGLFRDYEVYPYF